MQMRPRRHAGCSCRIGPPPMHCPAEHCHAEHCRASVARAVHHMTGRYHTRSALQVTLCWQWAWSCAFAAWHWHSRGPAANLTHTIPTLLFSYAQRSVQGNQPSAVSQCSEHAVAHASTHCLGHPEGRGGAGPFPGQHAWACFAELYTRGQSCWQCSCRA